MGTTADAAAIDVVGLGKTYRRGMRSSPHRAIDGLDLQVAGGGRVHGFLGPNGSGKTTTLRILLGLVRADEGSVRMLGREVPHQLPEVVSSVGSLVEQPTFFRTFTGRRNLQLLADVAGLPGTRVDEVLDLVGLRERAGERVKGYSLGMRQRLGIAAALLRRPQLLILDEPSNGLDPAGIREVRNLLRSLADSGITVVLSSHLLAEVQQVCDEVTIISRGRLVRSGLVADVLTSSYAGAAPLRVGVPEATAARALLHDAGVTATVTDRTHLNVTGVTDPGEVTRVLAAGGIYLTELVAEAADLEEVFLALTGDDATAQGSQLSAVRS